MLCARSSPSTAASARSALRVFRPRRPGKVQLAKLSFETVRECGCLEQDGLLAGLVVHAYDSEFEHAYGR
jgi:hypothetical protein